VRNNLKVNFVLCYHTLLDNVINLRLQLLVASQYAVWTYNSRIFGIVAAVNSTQNVKTLKHSVHYMYQLLQQCEVAFCPQSVYVPLISFSE
jgi:hypothetical protein